MFAKNKVSQSLIDAVNEVTKLDEAAPIKEPTPTGMRVYGRNYGNSAKAKQDQTKSDLDKVKGPKDKEMKEELKGDQHKIDANKNNKVDAHDFAILRGKKKVAEELKGDQHKIDANKNNKVDAHDFAILRGKKKVKESFSTRLAEKYKTMKEKKDVVMPEALEKSPAKNTDVADKSYLKDKPGSVKSDLKNLGRFLTGKKETNEEVEELDEISLKTATSAYVKRIGQNEPSSQSKAVKTIQHIAKKHGSSGVLGAAKAAEKEALKKEAVDSVPFDGPYTKTPSNVKDKSGAVHTPMSRAKDLARLAFKKVQDKTKIDK
jgi:hypothetical protein